jgi:hypothetical protein
MMGCGRPRVIIRTKTSRATRIKEPNRARYSLLERRVSCDLEAWKHQWRTDQKSLPMKGTRAMMLTEAQRWSSSNNNSNTSKAMRVQNPNLQLWVFTTKMDGGDKEHMRLDSTMHGSSNQINVMAVLRDLGNSADYLLLRLTVLRTATIKFHSLDSRLSRFLLLFHEQRKNTTFLLKAFL